MQLEMCTPEHTRQKYSDIFCHTLNYILGPEIPKIKIESIILSYS